MQQVERFIMQSLAGSWIPVRYLRVFHFAKSQHFLHS